VAVVLDLTMPGLHGTEVLREVRRLRPDMPVILSSGFVEAPLALPDVAGPPPLFLPKPYRAAELVECLRRVVERSPS
jgi:two-component system, cell cycle sensor histidine kinase and response regulator CckA